jgi:Domain of unknown function (DUF4340)
MRKGSFLALVIATVVLGAAAGWTLFAAHHPLRPPQESRRLFPGLAAQLGNLAWMRLSRGAMTADFNEIGGRWAVVEKGNYPAAAEKVRRLLLELAELTSVEPKTARPDLYARLDLDDPKHGRSTLVAVQNRAGKTVARLLIGKSRPDWLGVGESGVYVRKPGDRRSWLARGSLDLPGSLVEWLDRRILDIPAARIDRVTLTAADGAVLVLQREGKGGGFAVVDPPAGARFKGAAALAAPAGALAGLDLDDVAPRVALPVPPKGVAAAAFHTMGGLTVTLRLFSERRANWVAVAAAGEGDAKAAAAAINARLGHWTYAVPAARARLLRTRLADVVAPPKGS